MGVDKTQNAVEVSTTREECGTASLFSLVAPRRAPAGPRRDDGEERLVELARRGDRHAVGELYRRHADMIYRYTYSRVKEVAVAEDLTAQVFLKALEGLPAYRPTGAPFRAWLYRIAHARTVDYWRQQQRRQEVILAETLASRDPLPDEVVAAKSEWESFLELLAELTDDQRDVVVLRFIEEMSLAEVAETLGKTVGAVKALQHRALASLVRLRERQTTVSGER